MRATKSHLPVVSYYVCIKTTSPTSEDIEDLYILILVNSPARGGDMASYVYYEFHMYDGSQHAMDLAPCRPQDFFSAIHDEPIHANDQNPRQF